MANQVITAPDGRVSVVDPTGRTVYSYYPGGTGPGSTPTPTPTPQPTTSTTPRISTTQPVSSPTPAPTTSSQTSLYSGAANYTGPSITDFLRTAGQASDFTSRQRLATQYGIQNYTGSATQNTQLLNILKGYATGNVSPLGIPNTLSSPGTLPSPGSPLPIGGLPAGDGLADLNKILGANLPAGTVSSDIAGLLALYGKSSESQTEYEGFQNKLTELMTQLGGQSADLQDELKDQGVFKDFAQVKELTLKAAQLRGELEAFDAETLKLSSDIEDQAIPTGLILGQQGQLQKQRDLTRLSKAAALSGTIALAEAYRGNANIGLELATKMVDLKYTPILNQINVLKTQLGFAQENLSAEDKKRATIIGSLLDLKLNEIEQEKADQLDIQKLAIEAASNGAPLSVVQAMQSSTDLASAASLGGSYLKGSLESISSKGSDGPSTVVKLTPTDKQGLLAAGFTSADITQIEKDVSQYGVEGAVKGLSTVQANAIRAAYGGDTNDSGATFLTKDYLRNLFPEDQLVEAAKAAGFGGFLKGRQKIISDYLTYLEGLVQQYREAGFSDQEILKKMQ